MSQLIFASCCSYFKNVNCEMLNEWMRNKLGLVRLTCGTDVVERGGRYPHFSPVESYEKLVLKS